MKLAGADFLILTWPITLLICALVVFLVVVAKRKLLGIVILLVFVVVGIVFSFVSRRPVPFVQRVKSDNVSTESIQSVDVKLDKQIATFNSLEDSNAPEIFSLESTLYPQHMSFGVKKDQISLHPLRTKYPWEGDKENIAVRLSSLPIWQINLAGISSVITADLSALNIRNVAFDGIESAAQIRIGADSDKSTGKFTLWKGSLTIICTKEIGIEAYIPDPTSQLTVKGLIETQPQIFRSADFDTASHKIKVTIQARTASVAIIKE